LFPTCLSKVIPSNVRIGSSLSARMFPAKDSSLRR
jgi:hypothetical protein